MASINVKFRQSNISGHKGTIYYSIIHRRTVRQLSSEYHLMPDDWDAKRSMVRLSDNESQSITALRENILRDIKRFDRITRMLKARYIDFTTDDIVDEFCRYRHEGSLTLYMQRIIKRMITCGRERTAENYRATLNSFCRFIASRNCDNDLTDSITDILIDNITSDLMQDYEAWLRQRGIISNTVSFYCRILRAVYNRAVNDNLAEDSHPFRHVYTGIDKTVKRALPINLISRLKALDLSGSQPLEFARDIFMMCFFMRGISFIDLAFLRKSDLSGNRITYRRRKTGQLLVIRWTSEMKTIAEKYYVADSPYLLPLLKPDCTNQRKCYKNAAFNINKNLKKIAAIAGIDVPLTLYVARHSWASAARDKGIPLSVISRGMGHDSELTTRIYLSSIDSDIVDRANARILRSI